MPVRKRRFLFALVGLFLAVSLPGTAVSQIDDAPGVRGNFYESPSFGWILIAPEPWQITGAFSENGVDAVELTADLGDGIETQQVYSYEDDGSGIDGCIATFTDQFRASFPEFPVEGGTSPQIELSRSPFGSVSAFIRVVRSLGPGGDLLGFLTCAKHEASPLIIMTAQVWIEGNAERAPQVAALWPGDLHTGQPRNGHPPDGIAASGVLRFLSTGWQDADAAYVFPFNCMSQEFGPPYRPPSPPPPPGTGYFPCDGQIANVDSIPASIDLTDFVLGCERVPASESLPSGCTGELVPAAAYEVIAAPPGMVGPVLTLQPGESAQVVIWFALPEGDVPLDIYYLDGQERPSLVLVGPTFFTQGTGSRPRVRIGR